MKLHRGIVVAFILVFGGGCSGKPDIISHGLPAKENKLHPDYVDVLENAEKYEIFSLHPHSWDGPNAGIEGCDALGKTAVTDTFVRKQVAAALYKSVNQGTSPWDCFSPRPGPFDYSS